MKKILCPTDFSELADNAIVYAAKLTRKAGGTLTLLHVRSLVYFDDPDKWVGEESEMLESKCLEISRVFRISCQHEVATSYTSVTKTIGKEGRNFDLLVMGTNGTSDLMQFFYGSNTYRVIRSTDTPVLLVPENCMYSEVKHIVFAFDYWRTFDLPLDTLLGLARFFSSRITILQIMEESVSERANQQLAEFQSHIRKVYAGNVIGFDTIHTDDLNTALHAYMLRTEADLLALYEISRSSVEKLFHKSVIKRISGIAPYPVFVFQ